MRRWWPAVLAGLLAACGGTEGGGPAGAGGSGGGGAGPGIPVALSWIEFDVRTAVLGQSWSQGPSPFPLHVISLGEQAGGCASLTRGSVGPGPHQVQLEFDRLAVGTCPLGGSAGSGGCRAWASVLPGFGSGFGVWYVAATGGELRIDETDGTYVKGELRIELPVDPEVSISWSRTSDGDVVVTREVCRSVSGRTRECQVAGDAGTCCNEGRSTETLTLPIDAALCAEAVTCDERPCGAVEALECVEVTHPGCEAACAPAAAVCHDCWACEAWQQGCAEWRDASCGRLVDSCLERCGAEGHLPGVAYALNCLAQVETCADFGSCLAAGPGCEFR